MSVENCAPYSQLDRHIKKCVSRPYCRSNWFIILVWWIQKMEFNKALRTIIFWDLHFPEVGRAPQMLPKICLFYLGTLSYYNFCFFTAGGIQVKIGRIFDVIESELLKGLILYEKGLDSSLIASFMPDGASFKFEVNWYS